MKKFYITVNPDDDRFVPGSTVSVPSNQRKKPARWAENTIGPATDVINCVASRWPVKIFEVTGRPVLHDGHDYAFRQVRVLAELPAHLLLGPQGEELLQLAEKVQKLTDDDLRRIVEVNTAALQMQSATTTFYDMYKGAQIWASTAAERNKMDNVWNIVKKVVVEPSYTIIKTIIEFTALGLMTKHLIGDGNYTEHNYKVLTAVWSEAMKDTL